MKVEKLIEKLRYAPRDADVVIVIPKDAVPREQSDSDVPNTVAYSINKVYITRDMYGLCEIGISF